MKSDMDLLKELFGNAASGAGNFLNNLTGTQEWDKAHGTQPTQVISKGANGFVSGPKAVATGGKNILDTVKSMFSTLTDPNNQVSGQQFMNEFPNFAQQTFVDPAVHGVNNLFSAFQSNTRPEFTQPHTNGYATGLGYHQGDPGFGPISAIGNVAEALWPARNLSNVLDQQVADIPLEQRNAAAGNVGKSAELAFQKLIELPSYISKTGNALPVAGEATKNIALFTLAAYLKNMLGAKSAIGSSANPIQMDITPETVGPQYYAQTLGQSLSGGDLPRVMYNAAPQALQNVASPIIDATGQFAQRAIQNGLTNSGPFLSNIINRL